MADFADRPDTAPAAGALALITPAAGARLGELNLYAAGAQIAHRAARASTRRQYAGIYERFCDLLRAELGRPPVVADLGVDAIAAYARHLETRGGRDGGPASLSTRRVHLTMLRALAQSLGLEEVARGVRLPAHRAGPPETITDADYANLVRAPDRRTRIGRRDHAILRLLGDCGIRNAELRALEGRAVRRPRANARHHALYVHGKGGTEREVPIPSAAHEALIEWLSVHPLRRGASGIADREPLFVRLGPAGRDKAGPLSNAGLHKLMRRHARAAGIAPRLAHPHTLRAYYATTLAAEGVPVHVIARRLGHADLQTTSRYLVETGDDLNSVADLLDRRHQAQRRRRLA